MNTALPVEPPAIIKNVSDVVSFRRMINTVVELNTQIHTNAIIQGIHIADLKVKKVHEALGCDSWKSFVVQYLGMSYETSNRRVRAGEWNTVFGIPLEDLYKIDYGRLSRLRKLPEDDTQAREIVDKLHDGASDTDIWEDYGHALADPPLPVRVFVCKHCHKENEIEG